MSRPRTPLSERFWSKVDKSGDCWEWTASKGSHGYGQLQCSVPKRTVLLAHRISYEIAHGPIPAGLVIDHKCLNRGCVNPDHLRAVSHKQNMENLQGARGSTGVRGVFRVTNGSTFGVRVTHNKERHYLGTYRTLAEAEAVAIAARNEFFTCNEVDRRRP